MAEGQGGVQPVVEGMSQLNIVGVFRPQEGIAPPIGQLIELIWNFFRLPVKSTVVLLVIQHQLSFLSKVKLPCDG